MRFFVTNGIALGIIVCAATLPAQQASPLPSSRTLPADSLYVHAQRLVNDGKGAEGRAIVDSLFRSAPNGSPAQAEALFWRATLATTAAEAERDYRQITVEHPLSGRAEDALLRLAQLELQRGDRALALAHLERLLREHGNAAARARGSYWSARVLFEMNDVSRACASLGNARAALSSADVELRNQIEYAAQRCPAMPATTASAPAVSVPSPVTTAQAAAARDTAARAFLDSAASTAATTTAIAPSAASASAVTPSVVAGATTPAVTAPSLPPTGTPAASANRPGPSARTTGSVPEAQRFSVQVAAYQTKVEADRLVKKFRSNGYDARTYGTVAPFRVRIGHFRTRAEAVDLAKVLKEKSGAAFVVVAEVK